MHWLQRGEVVLRVGDGRLGDRLGFLHWLAVALHLLRGLDRSLVQFRGLVEGCECVLVVVQDDGEVVHELAPPEGTSCRSTRRD